MPSAFGFKTGEELRKEREAKPRSTLLQSLLAQAKTPGQQVGTAIGFALGDALAGAFQGDAPTAAGDIDLSQFDGTTPQGLVDAGDYLIKNGFMEEGLKLKKNAQDVLNLEQDFASDTEPKELPQVSPVTDHQRESIAAAIQTVPEDVSPMGKFAMDIALNGDDKQKRAFRVVLDQIGSRVNTVSRDLRVKGISVPPSVIQDAYIQEMSQSDVFQNDAWFFGTDGIVDLRKLNEPLSTIDARVAKMVVGAAETGEPIKTAPATPSTNINEPADILPPDAEVKEVMSKSFDGAKVGQPIKDVGSEAGSPLTPIKPSKTETALMKKLEDETLSPSARNKLQTQLVRERDKVQATRTKQDRLAKIETLLASGNLSAQEKQSLTLERVKLKRSLK